MNVTSESATPAPAAPEAAAGGRRRRPGVGGRRCRCSSASPRPWRPVAADAAGAGRSSRRSAGAARPSSTPSAAHRTSTWPARPSRGPRTRRSTLIEFADYECPFCIRHFTETMPLIEANYIRTGKVRYMFRDLPIDSPAPGRHPRARGGAMCHGAGRSGSCTTACSPRLARTPTPPSSAAATAASTRCVPGVSGERRTKPPSAERRGGR